ncbi:hypothetical protein [Thalassovita taeanensis]|uniref:Peptide/nickel transport system permease protein n=1 Tax=Thalassovita taeanensis TaxID=657014 RepID=A0A1H9BYE2_9RHOB|nr:hypothetical protein [Thalassovita taeanensis]SEP93874.1 peptide/nickel transport system permease protein [Thalassovita taeanensis]
MFQYLIRRLLALVVFMMVRVVPGDPIDSLMKVGASEAQRAEIVARYGLDRSLAAQYLTWLGNRFHGNLGAAIVIRRSYPPWLARRRVLSHG